MQLTKMEIFFLIIPLLSFLQLTSQEETVYHEDFAIEPSQQGQKYVLARTALGTGLFSLNRGLQQQSNFNNQRMNSDDVRVVSSSSEQKPSRASLFFSGSGGLLGSLRDRDRDSLPARTILIPTSGALQLQSTAQCCPCAASALHVAAPSSSGALIAAPGKVN